MREQEYKDLELIKSSLPKIEHTIMRDEADYYGISQLIAKKLSLLLKPKSFAGWKHGWLYMDLKYVEQLTGGNKIHKLFLVAKKEQALFLKEKGFNAQAVGMPFIYADELDNVEIKRYKNSLLVMPPHSLPYTSHSWSEDTYAKNISELKEDFNLIVVCLHYSCVQKNLWIDAFKKYDIPYVIGADATDKNSLIRMSRLFRSFEYMTTNAIGSHVVYASYSGCKVSVYGEYQEYTLDDYKEDKSYQKVPFLLDYNLKAQSEKNVRHLFPFLFTHPKEAQLYQHWAEEELGKSNLLSLKKLSVLLGWTWKLQLEYLFIGIPKKIISKIQRKPTITQNKY